MALTLSRPADPEIYGTINLHQYSRYIKEVARKGNMHMYCRDYEATHIDIIVIVEILLLSSALESRAQ